jgi:hypothetical protein
LLIGVGIALIAVIGLIIANSISRSPTSGKAQPLPSNSATPSPSADPEESQSYAAVPPPTPTSSGQANPTLGQPSVIAENGTPAATITVTAVRITTTAGDGSGTAPQNGYYAIATITIETMPKLDQDFYISFQDFEDLVSGFHVSEGDGNAEDAIANANAELGGPDGNTVALGAGQKITSELLFDVASEHGVILYAPSSGPVIAKWSY